jgi:hypothetical protein
MRWPNNRQTPYIRMLDIVLRLHRLTHTQLPFTYALPFPSRKRTKPATAKALLLLHVALPLWKLLHCNYVGKPGMFLDGHEALTHM